MKKVVIKKNVGDFITLRKEIRSESDEKIGVIFNKQYLELIDESEDIDPSTEKIIKRYKLKCIKSTPPDKQLYVGVGEVGEYYKLRVIIN